jgi:hypothetical protein
LLGGKTGVDQKIQGGSGTKLPSGPAVRARDEAAAMMNVDYAAIMP